MNSTNAYPAPADDQLAVTSQASRVPTTTSISSSNTTIPTSPSAPALSSTQPDQDTPDARNSLRHILAGDPVTEPSPKPRSQILQSTSAQARPQPQPQPPTPPHPPPSPPPTLLTPSKQSRLAAAVDRPPMASTPGSTTCDAPAPPSSAAAPQHTPSSSNKPLYTANPTTTRRNANGSVSSVYSGNKIRHLKKDDGIPLWRKDIQYDFLKYVFEDDKKVFHKASDGTYGHSFADIYLDAMAKSSKCSKILKDKLLTERPAALNMAMVCLLVNVGRMNTTLNFFPEMRAQLRTYHSIPSLQAHQDPNAYKQLQDAPRLKSILKGATEDTEQPSTLEDIRSAAIPRTNPVNLIFVLSQYAPKISEMHFDVPRDFFDLVMKETLSSRSRATAFLWLMWWYLESDFSTKDALDNPYGPGRRSRDAEERDMPIKCPQFDHLTDEQATLENVDPEDEQEFGEQKKKEREAILMAEIMAPVVTGPKRTSKKGTLNNGLSVFSMASDNDPASPARDYGSPAPSHAGRGIKTAPTDVLKEEGYDSDQTRSASPTGSSFTHQVPPKSLAPNMRINTLLNDDAPTPPQASVTPAPAPPKGPGRGNWGYRRKEKQLENQLAAAAAAANGNGSTTTPQRLPPGEDANGVLASRPHGYYIPLSGQVQEPKRTRPLTVHQQAVERYRMENVNYILDRGLREAHVKAKRRRGKDSSSMARAWKRCRALPDMYDSEEEAAKEYSTAQAEAMAAARALVMLSSLQPGAWEINDWGEEAANLASGMRKVRRRTERWETGAQVVRKRDVIAAGGGEDVPLPGRQEEMYEDGEDMMDVDGEGVERSSLPDVDGEEDDEEEFENEYANGHTQGLSRGIMV